MNESLTFFETTKNFSVTHIRRGIAATALSASLLLLSSCGKSEGVPTPVPTPTEIQIPPTAEAILCPANTFTLGEDDSISSLMEEYFPDQNTENMTVVNSENTPIAEAEPGDTIRFLDPLCT